MKVILFILLVAVALAGGFWLVGKIEPPDLSPLLIILVMFVSVLLLLAYLVHLAQEGQFGAALFFMLVLVAFGCGFALKLEPGIVQAGQAEQGPLLLDCQTTGGGWGIFERQPDGTWVNDRVKATLEDDEEARQVERAARLCFFMYGE